MCLLVTLPGPRTMAIPSSPAAMLVNTQEVLLLAGKRCSGTTGLGPGALAPHGFCSYSPESFLVLISFYVSQVLQGLNSNPRECVLQCY